MESGLKQIDRDIRELLAEAHQMQASDSYSANAAHELIDKLLSCAKRADSVHYLYSAQLLRSAVELLRQQLAVSTRSPVA